MAERLKDMFFTPVSMQAFGSAIQKAYPNFDLKRFLDLVFDESFASMELKERMRHTTICLHRVLPQDYRLAIEIICQAAPNLKGFEAMSMPDYVELFGREQLDFSLQKLAYLTQFASAEFAIRPYLDEQPQKALPYLLQWTEDKNPHVRRLASEGSRPRLPWAMQLPGFIQNPRPLLPILEKLKNDREEVVRRSVANNLNDISKDHPDLMLNICSQWMGQSANTDKLVKHACRTLLKAGNKRALILFGFGDPAAMRIEELQLGASPISIGDTAAFTFTLRSSADKACQVRLEYAVSYLKSNGKYSQKVFQISEKSCSPGLHKYKRRQSFCDMSTRKHYPGRHRISIIVNGEVKACTEFELLAKKKG